MDQPSACAVDWIAETADASFDPQDPAQTWALELLCDHRQGGVLSCYIEEGYPFHYVSNAFLCYLGYTREAFFAATQGLYVNCIHPDDRVRVQAGVQVNAQARTLDYRVRTQSGEYLWLRDCSKRLRAADGKSVEVCVCQDITDVKELQTQLDHRTQEYDALAAIIPGGVCIARCDDSLTILYANAFYYDIFGYTPEQAQEVGFTGVGYAVYPPDRKVFQTKLQQCIHQKNTFFEVEVRERRRSGEVIWVVARCHYEEREGGRLTAVVNDVTRRKRMEEQLRIREQEYRIAVQHSGKHVVRYDLITQKIQCPETLFGKLVPGGACRPESVVHSGILDERSVQSFLEFFRDMQRGKSTGSCVVCAHRKEGQYIWYHMKYTLVYDDTGTPLQAVISYYDATDQREKELAYERFWQRYTAMPQESIRYCELNLTRDLCERMEGELMSLVDKVKSNMYSDMVQYTLDQLTYPLDRTKYAAFFARERLLADFHDGMREDRLEYRRNGEDGKPRWTQANVQLVQDPYSVDIKAFLLFQDINDKKSKELQLLGRSQQDPLTGLLNRSAFVERFQDILRTACADCHHALMLIDIDNFKQINDTLGHAYGDKVLTDIAHNLQAMLRADDLVGRLGGDEFVLCLKNIPDDDAVKRRAQFLCQLLFKQLEGDLTVSGSIGISMYPRDGQSFDVLYNKADIALYQVKGHGRNQYQFFQTSMQMSEEWMPWPTTPIDAPQARADCDRREESIIQRNQELLQQQSDGQRDQLIMQALNVAVWDWNVESGGFYSSPEFDRYLLKRQFSTALPTGAFDRACVREGEYDALCRCFGQALVEGESKSEVRLHLKTVEGEFVCCRLSVLCVRKAGGELQRVLGAIYPMQQP